MAIKGAHHVSEVSGIERLCNGEGGCLSKEFNVEEFRPAFKVGFAEFELDWRLRCRGSKENENIGARVNREGRLELWRCTWQVN